MANTPGQLAKGSVTMARLLISAAHKSSGKTTVSIGLCAALSRRGVCVQPFKKGPDYIDPMWLTEASGRDCINLDPYLMSRQDILSLFARHRAGADLSLVEGNKGLYDGLALDGSNSNAALAGLLGLPVVLVIDARGMTRGIAPLILGYQAFDPSVRIAGVILNHLGGSRHEAKLRAVIEHYTDVPVLGGIGVDHRLALVERHLGLTPAAEMDSAQECVATIGRIIGEQVELDRIVALAQAAPSLVEPHVCLSPKPGATAAGDAAAPQAALTPGVLIGVARDRAFGFYYADDLDALRAAGARLVAIDTLGDTHLPEVDGLFIGGGFPEQFMDQLAANVSLRAEIAAAIEDGLPVYAECGGLMYLARSLTWQGMTRPMVGALGADVVMHERPVGRGYVCLAETAASPWPRMRARTSSGGPDEALRGHEFHYSSLENIDSGLQYAYRVLRGHGIDGHHDGIVYKNVLASYAHLRSVGGTGWAERFIAFVRARVVGVGADHVQVDQHALLETV